MILLILFGNLPTSYPFRRARGGIKISCPLTSIVLFPPLPLLQSNPVFHHIPALHRPRHPTPKSHSIFNVTASRRLLYPAIRVPLLPIRMRPRDTSQPHIYLRILFLTLHDYVFVREVIIVSTQALPSKGPRKVVGTATTST